MMQEGFDRVYCKKNLISSEKEKIKTRLSKSDYENNIPFLAEEFDNFKKNGELKEVKIQGTSSFPWDADTYRTNVLLKFERGSTDFYLGWNKRQLNDLTTETSRPFPLIMPLATQSKTNFSAYDFLTGKIVAIKFSFIKSGTELSIKFQAQ